MALRPGRASLKSTPPVLQSLLPALRQVPAALWELPAAVWQVLATLKPPDPALRCRAVTPAQPTSALQPLRMPH